MPPHVWSALFLAVLVTTSAAQDRPLPKVVLIGDSIRLGYAPFVAKLLAGKASVVSPAPNGEDSSNVLRNLDEWVVREQPDVVHINAGLHDLKLKNDTYQVPLAEYEKNLNTILARLEKETKAKVIFATTTPIVDALHAQRKAGFDRRETDVQRYNRAAVTIMKASRVPVTDLHEVVARAGKNTLIGGDGTHYTPQGYQVLAAAVADSIIRRLAQPPE